MKRDIIAAGVVIAVALTVLVLGYARWRSPSRVVLAGAGDPSTNAAARSSDAPGGPAVDSPQPRPDGNAKAPPAPPSAAPGTARIPAALLSLLETTNVGIHPKESVALAAGRQAALIEAYRAADSIPRKSRIARVLAHIGDEQVVGLLTNALARERVGRDLTRYERGSFGQVAESLGFLARRYDSAFSFLMQGIEPAFWARHSGSSEAAATAIDFSEDCLRGLAVSRRPEVPAIFESVRGGSIGMGARGLPGSLVDAVYSYRMQQQYGDAWDNGEVYRPNDFDAHMRIFREWGQTPEGRDWRRWSASVRGLPEPVSRPSR